MKQPSLTDLNTFIAVASSRNFRRAADVLGVSHSALSHAIRGLESTLGTRLLNRTTRSVSLTQDGKRLLARLTPILGELNAALGDVTAASGHPSGVVRINGSEGAISLLLQTVVPRFHLLYRAGALCFPFFGGRTVGRSTGRLVSVHPRTLSLFP
jgi:DNA-binding transcriptional LysR family regulator